MATLPTPATATEVWLAAVHEEIVGLRQDLTAARGGERKPSPGKTVLEEPAAPAKRKGAAAP